MEEGIKKYILNWKKNLEETMLIQKLEESWKEIIRSKLQCFNKKLTNNHKYMPLLLHTEIISVK